MERIGTWQENHLKRYQKALQEGKAVWQDSWVDMMREAVYPHMDDYYLLLSRSRGSRYENFLHDMTERSQEQFWSYLPDLRASGYPVWDISLRELHLLLTAYNTALFEPVIHHYSEEEALSSLKTVEAFFLPGWKKLIGF